MPQNVPAFEFSDAAKQLRQFVYEHWCANGRGPNLRAVHEGTGLDRRTIVQGYKELQLGIICVVDQDPQPWGRKGLETIKAMAAELVERLEESARRRS